MAQVAPFMELNIVTELYDTFAFDYNKDLNTYVDANGDPVYAPTPPPGGYTSIIDHWTVAYTEPVAFTCPSDAINDYAARAVGIVAPVYVGSDASLPTEDYVGILTWFWPSEPGGRNDEIGRTNYVSLLGASSGGANRGGELAAYRGMLGVREKTSLETIQDGTSNSIMFGENIGSITMDSVTGVPDRSHTCMWITGASARGRGSIPWKRVPPLDPNNATPQYPDPANVPDPRQGILGNSKYAKAWGVGSFHPAGVNFAFGDGSVRNVTRRTDWETLYAAMGAFDGQPLFNLD